MDAEAHSVESQAAIAFPSLEWFQRLARLMNENRVLHEHLGFIDCVAQFTVLDGSPGGQPWHAQITFEEFEVVDVRECDDIDRADFKMEATLATWRAMIESIARGHGRPELTQTLNYLSHTGAPLRVWSPDPLRKDMFFRYNQSLQEFVNASAAFRTIFPD